MKANHGYSLHTSQGIGVGTAETLRLGQRLYIALVMAFPINGDKKESDDNVRFPTDEILAYDIEIFFDNKNEPAKNGMRLSDLGLLAVESSIAYNDQILSTPGVPLPTFFLPGKNNTATTQSILLHGSCRKLHGDGEDCLASADELIATSVEDVNKRPRALFLTGDQIYADDVAMPHTIFN